MTIRIPRWVDDALEVLHRHRTAAAAVTAAAALTAIAAFVPPLAGFALGAIASAGICAAIAIPVIRRAITRCDRAEVEIGRIREQQRVGWRHAAAQDVVGTRRLPIIRGGGDAA